MHDQIGIRESGHHAARAARVVKVDMGQEDMVNRSHIESQPVERGEGIGQGVVAPGVDERNPTVLDHHVDGRQDGSHIARIERNDPVAIIPPVEHRHLPP